MTMPDDDVTRGGAPGRQPRISWTGEFADSQAEWAFAEGRLRSTRVLAAVVVAATSLCSVGFVPIDLMLLHGGRLGLFLGDRLLIAVACGAALLAVRRAASARRAIGVTTGHQAVFFTLNALVFAHPALDRHGGTFFPLIAIFLAISLPGSFRGAAALAGYAAAISLLSWGVVRPVPVAAMDLAIIGGLTVVALGAGLVVRLNSSRMAREAQLHLEREREIGQSLREAKEAAEEMTRAKAAFLAMMSHEIRTPMNGVTGLLQLALDDAVDGRMRDNLGTALESAAGLLAVLDDILDLSKLDSGRFDIEARAFDLRRLAGSVCDMVKVRADEKGLLLVRAFDPGLPPFVRSDPTRLRQVLSNLLGNAVKFTRQGSVRLAISPTGRRDGREVVRFEVEDTGIGIAAESRDRLFRDFSQVDASVARNFGGTGLGLAISKRLVELMGGRIGVHSEPGRGSTFWVELPVAAAERPDAGAEVAEAPPPVGRLRLLVAEDNPVNQKIALAMLSRHHDVALAADGLAAVARVAEGGFDLVLMDMQMPGLDGLEATRRIRALPGDSGRIPIVAMTANAFQSDAERCRAAGMDDFLPKPIDRVRLLATVARYAPAPVAP